MNSMIRSEIAPDEKPLSGSGQYDKRNALPRLPANIAIEAQSGQNIRHRDAADDGTVDHHRNFLSWLINLFNSVIAVDRLRIDLDLAINEVDDPIDRNAGLRVVVTFLATILRKRGIGDFDDPSEIRSDANGDCGSEGRPRRPKSLAGTVAILSLKSTPIDRVRPAL
jgi:hypothetical protein